MVAFRKGEDPAVPVRAYLPHFLAGYAETHTLDPAWLAHFPLFLKVRRAVLFAALQTGFPGDTMPPRERDLVTRMQQEIEADRPVIDLDFRQFA
jgi:Ser/Thr protein kinase RdoA (MazF antagonist)